MTGINATGLNHITRRKYTDKEDLAHDVASFRAN